MTNLTALVLVTIVTNAPTTNWITPSGKDIEVGRLIVEQHVISYTNYTGAPVVITNQHRAIMSVERFLLEEKWVPVPMPNIQRPPPLPTNR